MSTTTDQETTLVDHPLIWTKDMYYAAAEAGIFEDRRVELINGEIIEMSPMTSKHGVAIHLVQDALRTLFGDGYFVATQIPLDLGGISEPEPDVAVYTGTARDYTDQKPSHALLVVEISHATLTPDRNEKANLYAKAGIQDYWIINLKNNVLEVYRDPAETGYQSMTCLTAQDGISPLALPSVQISVATMLP